VLHVVVADKNGDIRRRGRPNLRAIRTYHLGGRLDLKTGELGRSRDPLTWFVSEDQEKILFTRKPAAQLVEGSEGSGKTTVLAQWHYVQWMRHLGEKREGLQTAPTNLRLGLVKREITKLWRPEWFRYVNRKDFVGYELVDGCSLRMVSTHKKSADGGSPIQGFNSSWAGRDETQDQTKAHEDIEARGRESRDGVYPQLGTATVKDSPDYRDLKSLMLSQGEWALQKLLVCRSLDGSTTNFEMCTPFVSRAFVESKLRTMTEREFRRRFFAEDQPPELLLYSTWNRAVNLRPIPFGARKITSIVLSRKTNDRRDALLIGHDPGVAKSGSVWLDAYELPPRAAAQYGLPAGEVLWWVRGELFTLNASHEEHATAAMKKTREQFGCNIRPDAERAHVRCQPLGMAEDKPDLEVFATWKRIGFHIRAAQYSKDGKAMSHIKKETRIGVVKALLRNAAGASRLFVECDDHGQPVAPGLVAALETMQRDDRGRAEHEEKDVKHDKSDLPAALGYGIYVFEKELALALRSDIKAQMGSAAV
jgi:hypothetical protein